jgi:histidinol-phosphatase (PHP family)
MFDYHVHTNFSGDCNTPMEEVILAAIKKNIKSLCFTEHLDYDYPNTDYNLLLEQDKYFNTFYSLRDKYLNYIDLKLGIEIGIQPHLYEKYNEYLNKHPFDFVICSTHTVDRQDIHNGDYFKHRSSNEAVEGYYIDILNVVNSYQNYDVYGHLNFIDRYTKYYNYMNVNYNKIKQIIDEILIKIIKNNKGIEVNTSGLRYGMNCTLPNRDILIRYKELGGTLITTGSDSHYSEHIGAGFLDLYELLKSIGFKYVAEFNKRNVNFKKI